MVQAVRYLGSMDRKRPRTPEPPSEAHERHQALLDLVRQLARHAAREAIPEATGNADWE